MIKSILNKSIIIAIFLTYIVSTTFASVNIQSKSQYHVAKRDERYFYLNQNDEPLKSDYENRFKRINDTLFYVNHDGVLYRKNDYHIYVQVPFGELDSMIDKELTSYNLYNCFGNNKYRLLQDYAKRPVNDSNTLYIKRNGNDLGNKVIVIGDSYAYLFSVYSGKDIPYCCIPGFRIKEIKNDFVDAIEPDKYKYCFICIGANDYMAQTSPLEFATDYQELVNELRDRNMKPIVMSYLDIDYNKIEPYYRERLKVFNHKIYKDALKSIAKNNNLLYIEADDLLNTYGYLPADFIHPAKEFYKALANRLKETVEMR